MRRTTATLRAFLGAAVVCACLGIPASAAHAASDPGAEGDFVARINNLRSQRGLAPLAVEPVLSNKARAWAQHMADAGSIFHSNLPDGVTVAWHRLGENVGTGPSVDSIDQALVASPDHYRNLTDPGFRYVGVGVVNANGTFFVSEVFMEPASQPAPSTSASAAGTPSSTPRSARPVRPPLANVSVVPPAPAILEKPKPVRNPFIHGQFRLI
jgi:hypothetical protein